jgi:hypothetical protein
MRTLSAGAVAILLGAMLLPNVVRAEPDPNPKEK